MNQGGASALFIAGFAGAELLPNERRYLADWGFGGLILFQKNVESLSQVVELNASILRACPKSPPLISVDQEGGTVARLRGICTDLPPLQALAPAFRKQTRLAFRLGAMMGRELVSLGFHLNFAPVCDVDSNPKNPVIGKRSFSHLSEEVAVWASQWISGMQGAGLAACAKHFPGHGDTELDSHLALPTVGKNQEALLVEELYPFEKAVQAQVATIMTAHVLYPALDRDFLATLSEPILTGLLRKKLGFDGVIISDDLAMAGIKNSYAPEEIIERGLLAGVDMFIVGHSFDGACQAAEIAHRLIEKSPTLCEKAKSTQQRIERLKKVYMGTVAMPSLDYAQNMVRCAPHLDLVQSCS